MMDKAQCSTDSSLETDGKHKENGNTFLIKLLGEKNDPAKPPRRTWLRPKKFKIADEATLKKMIAPCKLPEPEFKGKVYIHGVKITEDNMTVFQCNEPNCMASFTNAISLTIHKTKHLNRLLKCTFCGMTFKTTEDMSSHMLEFHPNLEINPDANPFQCQKCKRISRNARALWRHVRESHRNQPYPCPHCKFPFTRPENLKEHLERKHPTDGKPPTYPCKICGKVYSYKNSVRSHIREKHRGNSQTYHCVLCDTIYLDKRSYINHMKRHTNPVFFPCEVCKTEFRSKSHLKRHNMSGRHSFMVKSLNATKRKVPIPKTKSDVKQQKKASKKVIEVNNNNNQTDQNPLSSRQEKLLQLCNQKSLKLILHRVDQGIVRTSSVAKLERRKPQLIMTTTIKKAKQKLKSKLFLNCIYCNKEFKNLQSVKYHERICYMEYRNPKLNICPICNKEFEKPYKLARHSRSHTGERPFQCQYCDKFFRCGSTRITHEKAVHFGIRYQPSIKRVYECNHDGCNKQYTRDKQLQKHIAAVHLGIRHPCEKCGKIYRRKDQLSKHLKVDHAECPIRLECKPCNRTYKNRTNFLYHLRRRRHHRKESEYNKDKKKETKPKKLKITTKADSIIR